MADPYNEGRTVDRTKDHVNPYPVGSTAYNLWEDGYEDAGRKGPNSEWLSEQEANEIFNLFENS